MMIQDFINTSMIIYTEPVPNYLEGTSRRVSIEVYDDVDLFGDPTLRLLVNLIRTIIMYQLNFSTHIMSDIQERFMLTNYGVNTQPILFFNQPRISVTK